jgi:hypothetical protein
VEAVFLFMVLQLLHHLTWQIATTLLQTAELQILGLKHPVLFLVFTPLTKPEDTASTTIPSSTAKVQITMPTQPLPVFG